MSKPKNSIQKKQNRNGWLFVIVGCAAIALFSFYPMIRSFLTSLETGSGVNISFIGLGNYKRLLNDPKFKVALKNNILYLVIQVPIMTVLAVFSATLLNDSKLKGRGIFRTAIFLPSVTSLVAYSVLFKSLFSQHGIINNFLLAINIVDKPILWLLDPFWGKVTIILAITWRWTGYNMIFYLSAMQNIEPSIYEAAELDGASDFRKFTSITMPLLKPILVFTTIMSTNGTIQLFDEVANLTQGGPGNSTSTISQYIYNLSFKWAPDFGYASAISYVVVVLVAGLSFIQMYLTRGEDD